MKKQYHMVRIKRRWVPEWLYAMMSHPIDMVSPSWLPFRYILTRSVEVRESFKQMLDSAKEGIHYYIEGCFLAENEGEEELATQRLLAFIERKYILREPPQ